MNRLLIFLLLTAPLLSAQDVLFMRSGEKRSGKLAGLDAAQFRLQVPLPPPPGAPSGAAPMFASVSIARGDVEYIEFGSEPEWAVLIKSASGQKLSDVELSWTKASSWLSVPRSPSARIGNLLGDLQLRSGDPAQATRALELFKKIEAEAWSPDDKMVARQGRLRAMVATGNAKDAVNEAIELAGITENPAVLIEAKYILATAADSSLRTLLEKNPRWQEDLFVIPERHRLYHEALDLYLYPSLFAGSEAEASARGLWGAVGIYQLAGESLSALECARDITALYPGTKAARSATEFIASLPESQRAIDPEKDAREEQSLGVPDSKTPEKSTEKSTEEQPKKKPYEKTKTKKS